jgi:hypothetical protein
MCLGNFVAIRFLNHTISVGQNEVKIYDAVQRVFISDNAIGDFTFQLKNQNSSLLVFVPKTAKIEIKEGKLYADNVVINYRYSKK